MFLFFLLIIKPLGSDETYQSRADTCMLRFNRSTVLELYAITRHIASPGAVIFSTDDLLIDEMDPLPEKQLTESTFESTKIYKKLSGDSLELSRQLNPNDGISGTIPAEKQPISPSIARNDNNKFNSRDSYTRPLLNYRSKNRQKQVHDKPQTYQQQATLDEYDIYYDELNPSKSLSERYEVNRDIRSESNENVDANNIDNETNDATEAPPYRDGNALPIPGRIKNHPDTLWDLEMEREEQDALNGKES